MVIKSSDYGMSTPARISVYGRICFVLILLVLLLSYVNAADSQDPVTVVTPTVIPVNETAVPTPLEMLSVTPSFTLMEEATALPAITQNITSTPTLLQISTITILNQTSSQIAGLNTTDSSVPATVTSPSNTGGGYQEIHPLMHFTKDQLDEMQNQIAISPKYSAPKQLLTLAEPLTTGSKNLLSYLPYTPSERDQGSCGDCWVWASTGALEIDHNVKNGIFDRLSVQYFNSKYNSGQGSNWACCGGNLNYFTNWYNTDKTPIPWSNTKGRPQPSIKSRALWIRIRQSSICSFMVTRAGWISFLSGAPKGKRQFLIRHLTMVNQKPRGMPLSLSVMMTARIRAIPTGLF